MIKYRTFKLEEVKIGEVILSPYSQESLAKFRYDIPPVEDYETGGGRIYLNDDIGIIYLYVMGDRNTGEATFIKSFTQLIDDNDYVYFLLQKVDRIDTSRCFVLYMNIDEQEGIEGLSIRIENNTINISNNAIDINNNITNINNNTTGIENLGLDKADKSTGHTTDNFAKLDSVGNPVDSGKKANDFIEKKGTGHNNNIPIFDSAGDIIDSGKVDSDYVHVENNETINGIKTFSSIVILPSSDPVNENHATRKGYIDNLIRFYLDTYSDLIAINEKHGDAYTMNGTTFHFRGNGVTNDIKFGGSLYKHVNISSPIDLWESPLIPTKQYESFLVDFFAYCTKPGRGVTVRMFGYDREGNILTSGTVIVTGENMTISNTQAVSYRINSTISGNQIGSFLHNNPNVRYVSFRVCSTGITWDGTEEFIFSPPIIRRKSKYETVFNFRAERTNNAMWRIDENTDNKLNSFSFSGSNYYFNFVPNFVDSEHINITKILPATKSSLSPHNLSSPQLITGFSWFFPFYGISVCENCILDYSNNRICVSFRDNSNNVIVAYTSNLGSYTNIIELSLTKRRAY